MDDNVLYGELTALRGQMSQLCIELSANRTHLESLENKLTTLEETKKKVERMERLMVRKAGFNSGIVAARGKQDAHAQKRSSAWEGVSRWGTLAVMSLEFAYTMLKRG